MKDGTLWAAVRLVGSSALLLAIVGGAVQVLLKRMSRAETRAIAGKTTAEGESLLMDTWMRTVLAPTKERAERAEAKADDALGQLVEIGAAIAAHQSWDQEAAESIRRLGGTVSTPPPLRVPHPRRHAD